MFRHQEAKKRNNTGNSNGQRHFEENRFNIPVSKRFSKNLKLDISNIAQLDGNVSNLSDTLSPVISNQPTVNNSKSDKISAAVSLPNVAT